ncbi:DUF5672 family protein [Sphingobium olei]|uniref:DUF5672 family protein n=1 Tax=Sphingobium olei TaxID=420955 RepID=A0ABW3P840_9SPHN
MARRLPLPQVTLCAVSSVNVKATVRALEASLAQIDVGAALLLTDSRLEPDHPGIRVIPIAPITSARAYSEFVLTQLVDHVETSHCLVIQWDGHVLDATRWEPDFLAHDYIGASWPQYSDGHDVGNGGFSLRSRRLMLLCRDAAFRRDHPEDVAIGRTNRQWLEGQGMQLAPRALADRFAAERAGDVRASFGYHGVWLMPQAIGMEAFWRVYRDLDDRGTIRHDFSSILEQMRRGRGGLKRTSRLIWDQIISRKQG